MEIRRDRYLERLIAHFYKFRRWRNSEIVVDRMKTLTTLIFMKAIWMILSLVFGLLFFALGCSMGADIVQYFGVLVMIPGLIGFCDALWPEKES